MSIEQRINEINSFELDQMTEWLVSDLQQVYPPDTEDNARGMLRCSKIRDLGVSEHRLESYDDMLGQFLRLLNLQGKETFCQSIHQILLGADVSELPIEAVYALMTITLKTHDYSTLPVFSSLLATKKIAKKEHNVFAYNLLATLMSVASPEGGVYKAARSLAVSDYVTARYSFDLFLMLAAHKPRFFVTDYLLLRERFENAHLTAIEKEVDATNTDKQIKRFARRLVEQSVENGSADIIGEHLNTLETAYKSDYFLIQIRTAFDKRDTSVRSNPKQEGPSLLKATA